MGKLKALAGDTFIYGASTILGRLLNWLLMPFFIKVIPKVEYGEVTLAYSVISILLVLVTLGFETGYFRFVNSDNKKTLLSTLSLPVFLLGCFLIVVYVCFPSFFSSLLDVSHTNILLLSLLIVLFDSYNAIFFAHLRYERKSLIYAGLRFFQVIVNVGLVVFFMLYLRKQILFGIDFSSFGNVSYILLANLIGSLSSTLFFLPLIFATKRLDYKLLKQVLVYSLPLMCMGFFGMANQNIEKFMINELDYHEVPKAQLAIYAANYKIGVLMSMFTQSFRLAFEPFFFKENANSSKRDIYAVIMKYFVYFGLLIFASVMLFLPWVNLLLVSDYIIGNIVIPFILLGQLFFGVYYSLSMWYKAIDKTYYGIIMSVVGLTVNVILNFMLIPHLGYIGAAISTLVGYFVMMVLSLYLGNKYYPINYPLLRLSIVTIVVVGFVLIIKYLSEVYLSSLWFIAAFAAIIVIVLGLMKLEGLSFKTLLKYAKR